MFASGKTNAVANGTANYIEDVFSTYLYTGNDSTQSITNGIDLAGKGGLVWMKDRDAGIFSHILCDTNRGATKRLSTNTTDAQSTTATSLTAFNSNGFSLGSFGAVNNGGTTFASWTFREQPKFFDVVTYTGNGTNRTISHNLGSVPGCIIVKSTTSGDDWRVYHTSLGNTSFITLNATDAQTTGATTYWNSATPTSTVFSLGTNAFVNANGQTYVAYLFAHDAGGFGLTGTDNVISCGSYTGNGSTGNSVTLGYEPQWIMIKDTTGSTNPWVVVDNMRGMSLTNRVELYPSSSSAELVSTTNRIFPTATGFTLNGDNAYYNTNGSNYIYIAIRRGPMKVPTSGTSVFAPVTYTGNGATGQTITSVGFPLDFVLDLKRSALDNKVSLSRLTANNALYTNLTDAQNPLSTTAFTFDVMNGFKLGNSADTNGNGDTFVAESFRRAPSFFDEVCYTGTGSARTVTHNLQAVPELIICKTRSGTDNWAIYTASTGNTKFLIANLNFQAITESTVWNNTSPTSTQFTVGTNTNSNGSGATYVAYLFATCAGVSKVGSYTGTGTTLQVNCGFTGGARFVLIKRTDSTGDWYVWDSARGIVAGNDPYLLLNSTAAEVTTTDYIDTYSAGFEISSTAPAAINASGGTFIFFAVA